MPNEIEFDQLPDWRPLEKTVEPLRCSEFMHMGRIGTLQLYKHRHTRRYLNIDSVTGYCFIKVDTGYRYAEPTEAGKGHSMGVTKSGEFRALAEMENRNISWIMAGFFWAWIFVVGIRSLNTTVHEVTFARQTALRSLRASLLKQTSCMIFVDPSVRSYGDWPSARFLARADPENYAYLESHPVLVSFVGNKELAMCERDHMDNPSYSLHILGTSAILLNRSKLFDDRAVAAALSHELIHVRYGDHGDPLSRRSILSQLWLSEEAEAHLRGMRTAALLYAPGLPNKLSETVEYVYPISSTLVVMLGLTLLVWQVRRIVERKREEASTAR